MPRLAAGGASVWVPHATFHLLGFGLGHGPDTDITDAVLAEKELALDALDADLRLDSMLEYQSDSRLPGRIGVSGKAGAGDFRVGMELASCGKTGGTEAAALSFSCHISSRVACISEREGQEKGAKLTRRLAQWMSRGGIRKTRERGESKLRL